MRTKVRLKIADLIIHLNSDFPLYQLTKKEKESQHSERFDNFFYNGNAKPDIIIDVEVKDKLPALYGRSIFVTKHFQDGSENWRLIKRGSGFIYKSPLKEKRQVVTINKSFNRAQAYLLGYTWKPTDIIYDFLQVLLINYLAKRKDGIFTHSVGIKDLDGRGLILTGKSGAGKSTTARLWHKHTKAMVLNDDRIIIRKIKGRFFIYGSPWHGEFSDYLESRIERAPLENIFFIHHSPKNTIKQISEKKAFSLLYPALFPTFWDKDCLENIASFCADLLKNIRRFSLGFVNDRSVIDFVRKV